MRGSQFVLAAALVVATARTTPAQTAPAQATFTPFEMAVLCAPPPTLDVPAARFHLIGAQDVAAKTEFANRDLLVIDGGSKAGVQLGQQFFVRRANRFGMADNAVRRGSRTLGWVRIVAVNESTAVAAIDHVCSPLKRDDYLEPFVAPTLPAGAESNEVTGEPDFTVLGKIVVGDEGRTEMGAGDFALIDRGADQGVKPGARFALYRDVKATGMPLASIGELVVISTGPAMSLTRITRAQGPITTGDFVAPRK
jgi:hypothetical protein